MPRVCREAGARIDTRAPVPHLTVARPDRRITDDDRSAVIDWIDARPRDTTPLVLARPTIYRWATDSTTRRYDQLSRVNGPPSPKR